MGSAYSGSKNIKGQRNGAGKLALLDGRVFSGHFKNGKAVKGLLAYPNGDSFEGTVTYEFYPANGVFTWVAAGPNRGCIYRGPFSTFTHMPHGSRGVMVYPNQTIYDGPFSNGKKHGIGIVAYPESSSRFLRFEGTFVNNVLNGQGSMEYKDGSKSVGNFTGFMDNPVRQGRGRTDDPNGDWYSGNYSEDKRQGVGTSRYQPKSSNKRRKSFSGDVSNITDVEGATSSSADESSFPSGASAKESSGAAKESLRRRSFDSDSVKVSSAPLATKTKPAPSPSKAAEAATLAVTADTLANKQYMYHGQWAEDKRHGKGRETLPSGGYYDGEWENDLRHGEGEYMFPDRRLYVCSFRNGVKVAMRMKADGNTKVSTKADQRNKESCKIS